MIIRWNVMWIQVIFIDIVALNQLPLQLCTYDHKSTIGPLCADIPKDTISLLLISNGDPRHAVNGVEYSFRLPLGLLLHFAVLHTQWVVLITRTCRCSYIECLSSIRARAFNSTYLHQKLPCWNGNDYRVSHVLLPWIDLWAGITCI